MINPLASIRNYQKSIKIKFNHRKLLDLKLVPYEVAHKLGFKLLSL